MYMCMYMVSTWHYGGEKGLYHIQLECMAALQELSM